MRPCNLSWQAGWALDSFWGEVSGGLLAWSHGGGLGPKRPELPAHRRGCRRSEPGREADLGQAESLTASTWLCRHVSIISAAWNGLTREACVVG